MTDTESRPRWRQVKLVTGNADSPDYLERLRVPGGWLYRSTQEQHGGNLTESMVFVPDTKEGKS